ncbi:pyrroline-5-carboxylate reductase [Actinoplanes philippinensis]|uniref:Pyrroline-5-carboxylate reductase n=1 Tax=Actinoplanes philippinensis TaxID=35752 RepID=A0A1I2BPN7_9ACTN|nr:pyrroline-5-carboxylate reductase [Actinoplanes philippinensis]GIE76039.1 pyrroline-5-carboxylate reductase [Actinoplanes philippinensis]SFE58101.1 pyrroline-5-carboxylate reductase [Actinoplanes philippinensis]
MSKPTVAVLGTGKIGELVVAGLLRSGWPQENVLATARRPVRAAELTDRYGVDVVDNATAAGRADVLAIAVKPQDAGALLDGLAGRIGAGTLVVSLCAGLPTGFFASRLPEGTPVIRVMTNTPAIVDQAMTAISAGPHATGEHLDIAEQMFKPLGVTVRVPEYQQDAVTAISGSGPAYFYLFVEAMIEAGVLLGLPRAVAHELAVQTAAGSAAMLRESGEHPVKLREAVTSPAGTTAAALRELERHGIRSAVLGALEAARDRAGEIAAQAR